MELENRLPSGEKGEKKNRTWSWAGKKGRESVDILLMPSFHPLVINHDRVI